MALVYEEFIARRTGRKASENMAHVWTFRDGAVGHFQIFDDTAAEADAYRGA